MKEHGGRDSRGRGRPTPEGANGAQPQPQDRDHDIKRQFLERTKPNGDMVILLAEGRSRTQYRGFRRLDCRFDRHRKGLPHRMEDQPPRAFAVCLVISLVGERCYENGAQARRVTMMRYSREWDPKPSRWLRSCARCFGGGVLFPHPATAWRSRLRSGPPRPSPCPNRPVRCPDRTMWASESPTQPA